MPSLILGQLNSRSFRLINRQIPAEIRETFLRSLQGCDFKEPSDKSSHLEVLFNLVKQDVKLIKPGAESDVESLGLGIHATLFTKAFCGSNIWRLESLWSFCRQHDIHISKVYIVVQCGDLGDCLECTINSRSMWGSLPHLYHLESLLFKVYVIDSAASV